MDALQEFIAEELSTDLAADAPKRTEVEQMAEIHSRAVVTYEKRVAEARRVGQAKLAALAAEQAKIRTEYEARLARIAAEITAARTDMATRIATAQRLADVSRAALEVAES